MDLDESFERPHDVNDDQLVEDMMDIGGGDVNGEDEGEGVANTLLESEIMASIALAFSSDDGSTRNPLEALLANIDSQLARDNEEDSLVRECLVMHIEGTIGYSGLDLALQAIVKEAHADLLWRRGQRAKAESLIRESLAGKSKVLGSEHPATIRSIEKLALLTHARAFVDPVQNQIHDPATETSQTKSASPSPTDEADALFERVANAVTRCPNSHLMERQGSSAVVVHSYLLKQAGRSEEARAVLVRKLYGPQPALRSPLKAQSASSQRARADSASAAAAVKASSQERRRRSTELKLSEQLALGRTELLNTLVERTYADSNAGAYFPVDVMHLYEQALGRAHPATIAVSHEVALTAQAHGDHEQAALLFRRVMDSWTTLIGTSHPATTRATFGLAAALLALDDVDEAEPLLRRAHRGFLLQLGARHVDTIACCYALASLFVKRANYNEAEHLLWREIATCEELYGRNHPSTLRGGHLLGIVFLETSVLDEAHSLLEKIFVGRQKLLGPKHQDTIETVCALMRVKVGQGKHREAEELFSEHIVNQGCELSKSDSTDQAQAQVPATSSMSGNDGVRGSDDVAARTLNSEDSASLDFVIETAESCLKTVDGVEQAQVILRHVTYVLGKSHPKTLDLVDTVSEELERVGRGTEASELQNEYREDSSESSDEEEKKSLVLGTVLPMTLADTVTPRVRVATDFGTAL